MNWGIFITIYLLQIALTAPAFIDDCKRRDITSTTLYLAHHALDVFLFWALLFITRSSEHMIHIILTGIVLIHWWFYNNRCIATVELNRMCGWDEGQWLDSLKNRLGLRQLSEWFHFYWMGGLLIWDLQNV